jgi:hypothetical protein
MVSEFPEMYPLGNPETVMKLNSPVPIREAYRGYTPPAYVLRTVTQLLRSTPNKYLAGLDCVVLTNFAGQPRRKRVGKLSQRGRKVRRDQVAGLYHPTWQGNPPWIELYIDKIIHVSRSRAWQMPLLRDLMIGEVLYHELGHHIHYWMRPEYKEEEDVAENWSRKLFVNHVRRTYWYLLPLLLPAAKLFRVFRRRRGKSSTSKRL